MTSQPEPAVLARKDGRVGRLTLNRPRAINALDHAMVHRLDAVLTEWEQDEPVRAVLLTGAGERGLCAGGDIRYVHDDAKRGGRGARAFFHDEYLLNHRISRYPKPYVAVMDGLTLGGGVGLSAHGSVRIVTERSSVGMPETAIGFVPDVGGSYLLSRAPGELGTHLALTSGRMTGADAVSCGFADHYLPSDRLPAFTSLLASVEPAVAVAEFAVPTPDSELAAQREWIDHCYAADSVEEIVDRLLDQACRRPRRRPNRSPGSPRPRSRSPWPPCAGPVGCPRLPPSWTRSTGSPGPPPLRPT